MILIDLPRGRELAYLLKKLARKDGEQEFARNCLVRLKGGMLTDEEAQIIRKRTSTIMETGGKHERK